MSEGRVRTIPISLLLLSALGCGTESRISASAVLNPPLSPAMLTITVTDGERVFGWDGVDFRPRPENATPSTPDRDLSTSGPDIMVTFRLVDGAQLLSQGTVTIPRRSDWHWGVTVFNRTEDPERGCFGCFGSVAFDLPPSYRTVDHDSIWVVWGGNSISNPVTY